MLLDQFGVLHDGKHAYAGAVDAVSGLAKAGLSIIVLSNSSRSASALLCSGHADRRWLYSTSPMQWLHVAGSDAVIPKLGKMGFAQSDFAGAITSGEVAHRSLQSRQGDFWEQLGKRCIHLTWGARGQVTLSGLDLEVITLSHA